MSIIGDYLNDTRTELKHVTWPTQVQTTVYTILVIAVSVGIAVYLGFFDYIFTGALSKSVGIISGAPTEQTTPAVTASSTAPSVNLNLGTSTNQ